MTPRALGRTLAVSVALSVTSSHARPAPDREESVPEKIPEPTPVVCDDEAYLQFVDGSEELPPDVEAACSERSREVVLRHAREHDQDQATIRRALAQKEAARRRAEEREAALAEDLARVNEELRQLRETVSEMRAREDEESGSWRVSDDIEAFFLGVSGMGLVGHFSDFGLGAGPGDELPDVLVDRALTLDGTTWMAGGGARLGYQSSGGFRIGLGVGAARLGRLELDHEPLPSGVSVELKGGTLMSNQLWLGKAFDAKVVFPYVDAAFLFNVVLAEVDVSVAELGTVGQSDLMAFSFGIAPRLGVFVPVDRDWFFDFSGHYGLFGVERGGGQVSFGFWGD
ncbi:MAG: hypothetical protein R3B72_34315 [Polyangiaceae bacterium]